MAKSSSSAPTADSAAPAPDALAAPQDNAAPDLTRRVRFAGAVCPQSDKHAAKVYKTDGRTRYCKCNDCGATWKQMGSHADPILALVEDLVKSLDKAQPVTVSGAEGPVIMLDAADTIELRDKLRELLAL